jgi:tRNA pseudouridine38-40 synthase
MERSADRLIYTVRGSGFLKHMVRNIVGTLIETGRRNLDSAAILAFLSADSPRKAGPTAPAKGLALQSVEYPAWVTPA